MKQGKSYESVYASTGWVPTAGNSISRLMARSYISVNCDIAAADDSDDNLDIDHMLWYSINMMMMLIVDMEDARQHELTGATTMVPIP